MTTPTGLRGATAIAGIGYSRSAEMPGGFSRRSNETVMTLVLRAAVEACRDAGIEPAAVDGVIGYQVNDSVSPFEVLCELGVRDITYSVNTLEGGNFGSLAILQAAMAVYHGLATTCLVYRGMNARSGKRMMSFDHRTMSGGDGDRVGGIAQYTQPYGMAGPAPTYALQARRWMDLYGVTSEDLGAIAVQSRQHAINNPRALMREPFMLADHQESRMITDPYHLLDCCLETDGAAAVLVTSTGRARDGRRPAVTILGGVGGPTLFEDLVDTGFRYTTTALFDAAGVTRADIDVAELYDNFTDCPLRMIEDIGWCGRGESGDFVRAGHTTFDGEIPLQTNGGMMNEAFCHGMNNALELVQQLRGEAEDLCPGWREGQHTYDRSICRQVRDARVGLHSGSSAKTALVLGVL